MREVGRACEVVNGQVKTVAGRGGATTVDCTEYVLPRESCLSPTVHFSRLFPLPQIPKHLHRHRRSLLILFFAGLTENDPTALFGRQAVNCGWPFPPCAKLHSAPFYPPIVCASERRERAVLPGWADRAASVISPFFHSYQVCVMRAESK